MESNLAREPECRLDAKSGVLCRRAANASVAGFSTRYRFPSVLPGDLPGQIFDPGNEREAFGADYAPA
jgi:hypothetical protein